MTEPQYRQLVELGEDLEACLRGLGRMASFAADPKGYHSRAWGMLKRIFRTGIPELYREIQLSDPERLPRILKVDLMETADGSYRIAEVDGHNKHGLGYSTLAATLRRLVAPDAPVLPGAARVIAEQLAEDGRAELLLLYGDQERFYLPELEVLRSELAKHGVEARIASELECSVRNGTVLVDGHPGPRLWMDLPYLHQNAELGPRIAELYRDGGIDLLIPPKPFLGSKALLAVLRNDEQNPELEEILREYIPERHLLGIRRSIPETYVLRRKPRPVDGVALCRERPFVLKESISSGMKGTVFGDDPAFDQQLAAAGRSYYRFVLQEYVDGRARPFRYYSSEDGAALREADWFTRVTVHYALPRVADVIVTARQDKAVHGAPDCLQLGTVLPASAGS
ncbi:MAG: hypothetical protein Q8Q11_00075 [bacterium]|nr:hypothetical protein [bacterium]